jgi:hypothetical protein
MKPTFILDLADIAEVETFAGTISSSSRLLAISHRD